MPSESMEFRFSPVGTWRNLAGISYELTRYACSKARDRRAA